MKINDLKEIKMEYLNKINVPNNRFGIEIEFAGSDYKETEMELKMRFPYRENLEYNMCQKKAPVEKYETWKIKREKTVENRIEAGRITGGEINSPILTNNEKTWKELETICEFLKTREGIIINDFCSIHVHVEEKILPTLKEIINLIKLWIAYEDVIYKFSYGEADIPRRIIYCFARPFGQERNIKEIIQKLDTIETLKDLMILIRYERKYGLNITNLLNENKKTIEKRTSNGTINKIIIQNDARFTLNFMNYAKKENFDEEYINYKLKKYEPINIESEANDEKAHDIANRIYKEEIDKLYFYKQYYKAYEDDIEKTLHL